jgi:hypothetical protein
MGRLDEPQAWLGQSNGITPLGLHTERVAGTLGGAQVVDPSLCTPAQQLSHAHDRRQVRRHVLVQRGRVYVRVQRAYSRGTTDMRQSTHVRTR